MPVRHPSILQGVRRCAPWIIALLSGGAAHAASVEPAWRIESFCHRGAPPARRCLLQAHQGILVFRLGEFATAPTVRWSDGVAVLTSADSLRFFAPPQQLSAPFTQVRAYDTRARRVAFAADGRLHLRTMFGEPRDLAVFTLPTGVRGDALQFRFGDDRLHVRWRDAAGQAHEQILQAEPGA